MSSIRPDPERRGGSIRAWIAPLALLAVSGLLSIAVFEIVLRLGWIQNPQYELTHSLQISGDGPVELLILGDSFIAPQGLTAQLLVADLARQGVVARNSATSGTGPFEYLDELETALESVQPRRVLLSYYAGNDLTDVRNHPRFAEAGGSRRRSAVGIDRSTSRPLLRRFYGYHFLRANLSLLRARYFDSRKLAGAGVDPELIDDARHLRMNPYLPLLALEDRNHFLDNLLVEDDETLRAWNKVRQLLTEIHQICERHGAELRIVIFPHSIQIDDRQFDFFERLTFRLDERTLTTARPQERMREFCAERGIPLLDLLPLFRRHAGEALFLDKDDHLNPRGHRLAAQWILESLDEN